MKPLKTMLALAMLSFTACQSTTRPENEANENMKTKATLHWSGEIAADGCGFEVEIEGKRYLPENEDAIPAAFKASETSEIQLEYEALPEPIDRRCGMLPEPRVMPAIHVIKVEAI
ncbi:hypothetical protein [Pontibacter oryzae]|uniref:Uncharacterized protein n=1 Tax=Pontibacter oryzae TaxID=2304593 RepID=A0A399RRA3_9BACT|nr:hypothetical protein [Pontibacter oryzae]RIJ34246.1 hypothetical protein D1627_15060 [Pontibacter oryzae]